MSDIFDIVVSDAVPENTAFIVAVPPVIPRFDSVKEKIKWLVENNHIVMMKLEQTDDRND